MAAGDPRKPIMTSTPPRSVDQICDALRQSPLFQLSLASKELFHSNFLAWLCQTYSDRAGCLFAAFLPHRPLTCEGPTVCREWHNIDLLLTYPGGAQLVIENKVKSLPAKQQLDEYAEAFPDKEQTGFLLLSLTRPTFPPSDGTVWQYLSYGQLADKLRDLLPHIVATDDYHGQLLHDYIEFIKNLHDLQDKFTIDWDSERNDFFIARNDVKCLKAIRLHDLIDKIRYGQMERQVGEALRGDGFPSVRHEKLRDGHEGQAGSVLLCTDMTRGVGLFDLKYFVMDEHRPGNPTILGVQVQGNQFRLVVEVPGEDRNRALQIAKALWRDGASDRLWFDFGALPDGSEEYPRDGEFNQYGGVFRYRSKRLKHISPKGLVDAIVTYARWIREKEEAIRRQIETVS
jgi:hypothetical protein